MSEPSLFRRLFVTIFAMLLLLFMAGAYLVLKNTSRQIDADYDAQLIADSHTVWTLLREDLEEGDTLGELHLDFGAPMLSDDDRKTLSRYARWRAVRIWKDEKLSAQSENLKQLQLPKSKVGFSEQRIHEDVWRIYTVYVPDNKVTVEIWENLHNRHRLMLSIGRGLIEPAVVILPLLIILLMVSIRHGMKNLLAMAGEVRRRKTDDLSPIRIDHVPKELAPLHKAINMLLERIRQSISHERQFMDNVAHELKTPLAALRLQGELIVKAPTERARNECVNDLIKGIDRATHLFEQMLMFSRLSQKSVEKMPVDPACLIQDVISQRVNIALEKNIEIALEGPDVTLTTNAELLIILLGALLDNALKYTPPDGNVLFKTGRNFIVITDNGPGIPLEERERVFERFTRGKANQLEGSGLGLSIVKEICQKLKIEIALETPDTGAGLSIRLQFPDH